jgi:predicted dehydrogenase
VLSAKVIGAGSIGNHLTHALRSLGIQVTIVDVDKDALERTQNVIYPERYGSFDTSIRLAHPDDVGDTSFDLCVIGTPPDTHVAIATRELALGHRALLIEKPLASPGLNALRRFASLVEESPTRVLVAYNQRLKHNTTAFLELAQKNELGNLVSISGRMREDWAGILKAHPWLSDATESYLGHTSRGGGALYEHSHAVDFALFIAQELGQGRPTTVEATLDTIEHDTGSYDKEAKLAITMSSGMKVSVSQDLFTWPADKSLNAVFTGGEVRWEMHGDHDSVRLTKAGSDSVLTEFPKTRPDDFLPEMAHVIGLLNSTVDEVSPLDFSEALYTSWTLEAALSSHEARAPVVIQDLWGSVEL